MKKLVFFGTQHFGAAMLQALVENNDFEIAGVVTQPDRPIGRNQEVALSPVKSYALEHKLVVVQPETLKTDEARASLPAGDVAVVCQYGLIIPQAVLDRYPDGVINVHTSLLPQYRGASPIQATLMHGDAATGVTIMLMDAQMDHGPILAQAVVSIDPRDTYPTLSDSMVPVAQNLLVRTLNDWLDGKIQPTEQEHDQATFCSLLSRDHGKLDFSQTAQAAYNIYRGTYPWPGIWTTLEGKRLKLLAVKPSNETVAPGTLAIKDKKVLIGFAKGCLNVLELQLEGKKAMTAEQFIAGYSRSNGATLI